MQEVTDYILAQVEWQHAVLEQLREAVHDAEAEVEEGMEGDVPVFYSDGKLVARLFCDQDRVNISFPRSENLDEDHGLFTENHETGKGVRTIRIAEGEVVPTHVITRLVTQIATS